MSDSKAVDVAAYILTRGSRTAHDLQKLVYFAQAWSLAWDGRGLFDDRIEAWANGPVAPRLFREHRQHYTVHRVSGDPEMLSEHDQAVVDAVLDFYGAMGPAKLVELTHEDQPWIDARGDLPESAQSQRQITDQAMRRYYSAKQILGHDTPRKPAEAVVEASLGDAMAEAGEQMRTWRSTLDWLATR